MNEFISELEEISVEAEKTFGSLSAEQLNWKPNVESWSVAQCFEHLILTNNQMLDALNNVADGKHQNSFLENWSPLSGFFGNLLIKSLKSDKRKFKAPSKSIVPPSKISSDIIKQFSENNRKVVSTLGKLQKVDLKKIIITSPFLSFATYKLADGIIILVEHEKRHFRQATRILQMQNPTASSAN